MQDSSFPGPNPIQAWHQLLENTVKIYQAPPLTAGQIHGGIKGPWMVSLEQLWQITPLSKIVPLEPAETARAFRQMWLGALSDPSRLLRLPLAPAL